jgi:peptidoglycan hydrolase CwlO-like protein
MILMGDPETIDREARSDAEALSSTAPVSVDRITSFLFVSGAILLFLSAFLLTMRGAEKLLQLHFERVVNESIQIAASPRPPGESIRDNLNESVENSGWVRVWGVKVDVIVTARDGRTWLYVNGRSLERRYQNRDPKIMTEIHATLLPAMATVGTSVEHNTALFSSILIVYAAIFLTGFFVHNRNVLDRQIRVINDARESRDQAARTATRIEREFDAVRAQLREVEPAAEQDRDEIARLQSEQQELRARLESLVARERELRGQEDRVAVLEEDSRVLEGMLDEATANLAAKDAEIRKLEQSLKRADKGTGAAGRKSKASEVLVKRIRTLYPQLEIDDRAIDDIVALPDEATRLRAEECVKRLAENADNLGFRRKVKALPNHLSIYELAFAGKRRVYYAKAKNGRFRVLVIGTKKTQRSDLDYLAKIPREELVS